MLRHIIYSDVMHHIQDVEISNASVYIIIYDVFSGEMMMLAENKDVPVEAPVTAYEDMAKNILKGELKRRGITYAQLAEKLKALGMQESERNLANKISRGSFTAAFFMMCMDVIGVHSVRIET